MELRVNAANQSESYMMLYILPHFEVNYQVDDNCMKNPRNEGSKCMLFLKRVSDLFST